MKYKVVKGFYRKALGRVKAGALVPIDDKGLAAHLIAHGYLEKPKPKAEPTYDHAA